MSLATKFTRRPFLSLTVTAAAASLLALRALAQNKGEVKIALIASKSGPLEAYAKQTIVGFNLGLEYATGGTMMAGKKLLEKLGATVTEGAAIVDLPELGGSDRLRESGLSLFTLVDFAGH